MFRLRTGYLLAGIATGLILLFSFFWTLPDGKLHIVFCSVGQGDGVYIRFPDGRDMVIDGGPDNKIIDCLSRHMPFWDRNINIVAMTHPQKDHMQGLIEVFRRYGADYFVRSDVDNVTDGYHELVSVVKEKNIPVKFVTRGERIDVGTTSLTLVWPSDEQIAKGKLATQIASVNGKTSNTLGATTVGELNDYSLVFFLRYGSFDALFTGDADQHVEGQYTGTRLPDNALEVLKVPHHGSKTGMTEEFIQWLRPKMAVISVGKNSYGHPTKEALQLFESVGAQIHRTDKEGDLEIVSDGKSWTYISTLPQQAKK